MVYVKDLMELDYFKKNQLTLVAGMNGLKRIVKRPNIAQLMNFNDWMAGGEFLLVNGVGLHLDQPDQLLKLIENAQKGKAACIAFEISDTYLPVIPAEAKELADQLKLPIFTLSWDVPFGEILNTVYDYIIRKQMENSRILELMQNVLFADINEEYILEQAAFYGFHLETPHCVLIGDCIPDKHHEDIYTYIQRYLHTEFHNGEKAMVMNHNGHIVAFLPEQEHLTETLEHVILQTTTAFPNVRVIFGIPAIETAITKQFLLFAFYSQTRHKISYFTMILDCSVSLMTAIRVKRSGIMCTPILHRLCLPNILY